MSSPTDNLLLAALPPGERADLLERMRPVTLERGGVLYDQDAPVHDVFFFTSGAASLLILMEDGHAMEPGIIGREGMLGFPIGLGDDRSRWRSVMQIAGDGLVMSRADLSAQLRRGGDLPALLAHYAGLLITLVAQSAACAQFHSLEQRTARWLLLMRDRAAGDEFAITHEYLAYMLGANRPSETLILHSLASRGVLELRRGSIRIADREALERESCECYRRVQIEYDYNVEVRVGEGGGQPYPDRDLPTGDRTTPRA
ncbi:MAG: Crp/Fnr family transcriptional regulator [Dehalococcoidia bacterium]